MIFTGNKPKDNSPADLPDVFLQRPGSGALRALSDAELKQTIDEMLAEGCLEMFIDNIGQVRYRLTPKGHEFKDTLPPA